MIITLEDIRTFGTLPTRLTDFDIKRAAGTDQDDEPDLITVWKTEHPVLTNYILMCKEIRIKPFGGGTYKRQAAGVYDGKITSGFRESLGAKASMHFYGMAIDVVFVGLNRLIEVAKVATGYFMRVGIYPDKNVLHLDLAPIIWQMKYNATPYWVCLSVYNSQKKIMEDKYTAFYDLEKAIEFAKRWRG